MIPWYQIKTSESINSFSLLVSAFFFSSEHINPSDFFLFDKYTFSKLPGAQFNIILIQEENDMAQDDIMYSLVDYWYMYLNRTALFFKFVANINCLYITFSNLPPISDCANSYACGTWTGGNDISVEDIIVWIGSNTPFTFTKCYGSSPMMPQQRSY